MGAESHEHQLGDFIKGRLLFVEDYTRRKGLNFQATMEAIREEALRLAHTPERQDFLKTRLFGGTVLSSSFLPDWLDRVFLEAMTHVLRGPGASLTTNSSRLPCIPYEAGRFNALRQADTVFRVLFENKRPEEWLRSTFPVLYRKCYGEQVLANFSVVEMAPQRFRVTMDNRTLEKSCPMDCSTTIGYLVGALEKLGGREPLVVHTQCGAAGGEKAPLCIFELSWK